MRNPENINDFLNLANDFDLLAHAQRDMLAQFAFTSREQQQKPTIVARIEVQEDVLVIHFLNRVAAASPRVVISEGNLAAEYVFRLVGSPLANPLWQFLLVQASPPTKFDVVPSLDGERLYDHDNRRFPEHVLREVCVAILASESMKPSPVAR